MEIKDITVAEGKEWQSVGKPVIVLDAATAERALEIGQLEALVKQGLAALLLSGKQVIVLEEA